MLALARDCSRRHRVELLLLLVLLLLLLLLLMLLQGRRRIEQTHAAIVGAQELLLLLLEVLMDGRLESCLNGIGRRDNVDQLLVLMVM